MKHLKTFTTIGIPLVVVITVLVGHQYLQSNTLWTPPTKTPPQGNVPAPVHTGTTGQIKKGSLWINKNLFVDNTVTIGNRLKIEPTTYHIGTSSTRDVINFNTGTTSKRWIYFNTQGNASYIMHATWGNGSSINNYTHGIDSAIHVGTYERYSGIKTNTYGTSSSITHNTQGRESHLHFNTNGSNSMITTRTVGNYSDIIFETEGVSSDIEISSKNGDVTIRANNIQFCNKDNTKCTSIDQLAGW